MQVVNQARLTNQDPTKCLRAVPFLLVCYIFRTFTDKSD
jgi:hypothetical protein